MAQADPTPTSRPARPLSPHIQIYHLHNNMVMSILHRLTGASLYVGTVLLAWWLIAAATGPRYFEFVNGILATLPGKAVLLGYTWALMHHMLGGIRHLIWDTGRGFSLPHVNWLSRLTILGSLGLTAAIWIAALKMRGML